MQGLLSVRSMILVALVLACALSASCVASSDALLTISQYSAEGCSSSSRVGRAVSFPANSTCQHDNLATCSIDPISQLVTASWSNYQSDGSCNPNLYGINATTYTWTNVQAGVCVDAIVTNGAEATEPTIINCTVPAAANSNAATRSVALGHAHMAILLVLAVATSVAWRAV